MWRSLVAQQLWELMVAGSNPVIPIHFCPCSPTGRGASLRTRRLLVQIQPGVLCTTREWSNGKARQAHNMKISEFKSHSRYQNAGVV